MRSRAFATIAPAQIAFPYSVDMLTREAPMKRIVGLVVLGLIMYSVLAFLARGCNGIAKITGLEVEVVSDLTDWNSPERRVRIFGTEWLRERMAARMGLTTDAGWTKTFKSDAEGRSWILLRQRGEAGRLPKWNWSETTCTRDRNIWTTQFIYREEFVDALVKGIHEVRQEYLTTLSADQRNSLAEEFRKMIEDVRDKAGHTLDEIVLDAPVRLAVMLPGKMAEADGPGLMLQDDCSVAFEARTAQMKPPIAVMVRFSRFNYWLFLIPTFVVAGAAALLYYRWWDSRRTRRLLDKLYQDGTQGADQIP